MEAILEKKFVQFFISSRAKQVSVELEAILEKKIAQFFVPSRAKQVKVANLLTGESQFVEVYSDTSFNEFVNATVDKLLLNVVVVYSLPPPHLWKERVRVSEGNFHEVVSSVISGSLVDRPLLYAHSHFDSPECSPHI